MSKIKKVYNKQYKTKMIKIEQYKLDPNKEGHQLMVSWKVNKRKPPIIDGDDVVKPPRPPRKSFDERIAGIIKELVPVMIGEALKPLIKAQQEQNQRLEKIESRLERNNIN